MEPAGAGKSELYCVVFFNENIHQDTERTKWCLKQPFMIGLMPQTDLHHRLFSRLYCKTCNENLLELQPATYGTDVEISQEKENKNN